MKSIHIGQGQGSLIWGSRAQLNSARSTVLQSIWHEVAESLTQVKVFSCEVSIAEQSFSPMCPSMRITHTWECLQVFRTSSAFVVCAGFAVTRTHSCRASPLAEKFKQSVDTLCWYLLCFLPWLAGSTSWWTSSIVSEHAQRWGGRSVGQQLPGDWPLCLMALSHSMRASTSALARVWLSSGAVLRSWRTRSASSWWGMMPRLGASLGGW